MKSKNPRAYPEPINTILMYTYYSIKFVCRAWVYPNPLNEDDDKAQVVKHWTREEYETKKQAVLDFFNIDSPRFLDLNLYTSLLKLQQDGNMCAYYERLHRIRWKRMNDIGGFVDSKAIGFWKAVFIDMHDDYADK